MTILYSPYNPEKGCDPLKLPVKQTPEASSFHLQRGASIHPKGDVVTTVRSIHPIGDVVTTAYCRYRYLPLATFVFGIAKRLC